MKTERTSGSKNLDETVRLQSEKREERLLREVTVERLQGTAEDRSSAPRLASTLAASFPGKNECPGNPLKPDGKGERRQFLPDLP